MGIESWSTTASNNNASPPNGWPEGQAASSVNDCARQMMASIRAWYEDAQWVNLNHTPTRIDADTFTVATDLTALYHVGRRLKLTGGSTGYATISSSSYSAPNTTVNVTMDSGSLPNPLTTVSLSIFTATNPAIGVSPLPDGSVSLPALSFVLDPDSGVYRSANNTVAVATGGAQAVRFQSDQTTLFSGAVYTVDGSAAAPSISFGADSDSGIYRVGSNSIGISIGAANAATINSSGLAMSSGFNLFIDDGTAGNPRLAFSNETNTGIYRGGSNTLGIAAGGLLIGQFSASTNFSVVNGNVTNPAVCFINDPDSGLYRAAADNVAMSVGGFQVMNWTDTRTQVYASGANTILDLFNSGVREWQIQVRNSGGNFVIQDTSGGADAFVLTAGPSQALFLGGSASAPSLSFIDDADTGVYRVGANQLGLAAGGAVVMSVAGSGISLSALARLSDGDASLPGLAFGSDTDTGIYRIAANTIGISSAGALAVAIDSGRIQISDGSAGTPSLTFINDTNTGIYTSGADTLNFATGGTNKWAITVDGDLVSQSSGLLRGSAGSSSLPSLSFSSDTDTGFFRFSEDHIGIATGGASRGAIAGGSFTGTLSGMSGATTGTVNWFRYGSMVVLYGPAFSGTSNTTSMTMTGLPTAIQTGSASRGNPCTLIDNGVSALGGVSVSGGTATFSIGSSFNSSGFNSAGTKGFGQGIYATYFLAGS